MKYNKDDGKEHFFGRETNLENALIEVDKLPNVNDYPKIGNFLSFCKSREETVQFIRNEKDSWLVDNPLFENGKCVSSLMEEGLSTELVKEIVKRFFEGQDWKLLCNNLKRSR